MCAQDAVGGMFFFSISGNREQSGMFFDHYYVFIFIEDTEVAVNGPLIGGIPFDYNLVAWNKWMVELCHRFAVHEYLFVTEQRLDIVATFVFQVLKQELHQDDLFFYLECRLF